MALTSEQFEEMAPVLAELIDSVTTPSPLTVVELGRRVGVEIPEYPDTVSLLVLADAVLGMDPMREDYDHIQASFYFMIQETRPDLLG